MAKGGENCPMCANELNESLHFPSMSPNQIKTIINASNTNGIDDAEDGETNGEAFVNGDAEDHDEEEDEDNHKSNPFPRSAESSSSNATGGSGSRPTSNRS